ncbi:MAG: alpha/beta hydrolase [Flavobacteriales bacterium]
MVAFNGLFKLDSYAYSWFQFEVGSDGIRTIDESQELQSRKAIESWIPLLIKETGADPNRVFLFRFSQGAIMSASVLTGISQDVMKDVVSWFNFTLLN